MPVQPTVLNAVTGVDVADADAAVGEVAAPKTFYSVAPPIKTGTMANVALDPAANAYPTGYHAGAASLTAVDGDLIPANIMLGKTIFGVLGTMVKWMYDLIMPALVIPQPTIALAVVEDHSGGGFTATPSLDIPLPAISLATELSWLLIDDCEDAWDEYVQAGVTSTADAVVFKIGTASAKMAVGDAAAVGRLATEVIAADLSPYKYLKAWVRSSIAINSGDLSILLDEHPQCVSPLKDLNIGALVANTWTQITLDMGDTSGLVAIISIGVDMKIDKGIFDFWIDQVRATKGP